MIECESIQLDGEFNIPNNRIYYGSHNSPFGMCEIGFVNSGKEKLICHLCFVDKNEMVKPLQARFPEAEITEDHKESKKLIDTIFHKKKTPSKIKLLLHGTEFQTKVWETVIKIPFGKSETYDQIAKSIDKPKAARAVGGALKVNPINFLIPCHRVVNSKEGKSKKVNLCAELKASMQEYEKSILNE